MTNKQIKALVGEFQAFLIAKERKRKKAQVKKYQVRRTGRAQFSPGQCELCSLFDQVIEFRGAVFCRPCFEESMNYEVGNLIAERLVAVQQNKDSILDVRNFFVSLRESHHRESNQTL